MVWAKLREKGVLLPETFYSSPFSRCLHTTKLSFEVLDLPDWMIEIREELKGRLVVENGDGVDKVERKESDEEMDVRVRSFLDDIFENDESETISLTTHGGFIASMLRVVGHRNFGVPTGVVIPILVRAENQR